MLSRITVSFLLLAHAWASPNVFQRAACNRDNCLRAVVASSAAPGNAQGSADCSSFLRATVTPCPVTTTTTQSVTSTTTTSTTVTSNSVTTSTVIVSATTTTTATETDTATVTPTITNTQTVTTSTVVMSTSTVTTMTLGNYPNQKKRAVSPACSPVTNSPSSVPAYASACSGTSRYSSACSCNGISSTQTTIPASTIVQTTTSTATATVTGTSTTTNVQTSTVTSTNTATATVTTTSTVTVTASTITSFTTQTATSTSTSTVVTTTTVSVRADCTNVYNFCHGSFNCACYPVQDYPGRGVCAINGGQCGKFCSSSSECGDGNACAQGCCSTANDATQCANGANTRRMFKKRDESVTYRPVITPPGQ